MSHFSTVKTQVTDAQLLKTTIVQLGYSLNENADVRGYNGQKVRADIVALVSAGYDIGFVFNEDTRAFDLVGDFWGLAKSGKTAEQVLSEVLAKYAVNATLKEVETNTALTNARVRVVQPVCC